jgi:hypothetical protein
MNAMATRTPRSSLAAALVAAVLVLAACAPSTPALSFSPRNLNDGRVGQAYDETITVGNNLTPVLRFSIQNGFLPSGLNIALVSGSSNQGRISGTPLVAGRFSFEVVAQCVGTNVSGQQGSQAYTITVN